MKFKKSWTRNRSGGLANTLKGGRRMRLIRQVVILARIFYHSTNLNPEWERDMK